MLTAYYVQITVAFIVLGSFVTSSPSISSDYTWRNFDGEIPHDAFLAGIDKHGEIYIGQVLFRGKIIPGKIYKNDNNIYFENSGEAWSTTSNIDIFCTQYPEHFEWFYTRHMDYKDMKGYAFVDGGFDIGYKTFIGRATHNGEDDVGKVLCHEPNCLGLFTSKNGRSKHFYVYSVLIHKPRINDNAANI